MCGIFGGIGVSIEQGRAALDAIRRGNDGVTVRQYGDVVLGSRRHLVKVSDKLDVRPGESDQPYDSNDGRIHLVFNGELYNFAEIRDDLAAQIRPTLKAMLAAAVEWVGERDSSIWKLCRLFAGSP